MTPLKLGIVGVGGMGGIHARGLKDTAGIELVAVCDLNADMAQKVGEETGATPYTDYSKFLRSGLEAVLIATPHPFHAKAAIEAAKRGIHVLSEKPIAVTVREGDSMIAACREAGVLLGVNFQQRAEPVRKRMKEMVDAGVLGAIHRVEMSAPWYRTQAYYDSGAWRGTWKGEGGGILMNQAPHSLDQFLWIGGAPKRVQALAFTRLHKIEVENTCTALCDYGDGKAGVFYASTAEIPAPERFELWGDRGALKLENGVLSHFKTGASLAEHLAGTPTMWATIPGEWQTIEVTETVDVNVESVLAFARAVRANDPSLMLATGEDGLASLELGNAFLMAGFSHREVELPLNRTAYTRILAKLRAGA